MCQSRIPNRLLRKALGFTLIELSIVVIIIGLLVGGVLVGKDLLEAATLRKVAADFAEYKLAANTFKIKYNCLPGDCANATQFFPTALGNGNGNGIMDIVNTERSYFWQHLSLSGLIAGNYSGVAGYSSNSQLGVDLPRAAIEDAGIMSLWEGWAGNPQYGFNGRKENTFYLMGPNNQSGVLTPIQAKSVDLKIDDGIASTGKLTGSNSGCTNFSWNLTRGAVVTGDYLNIGSTVRYCRLHYFWQ